MKKQIDKKQIEAEWNEFCETGELPEAKPRVITMPEFLKMNREEVEKRMDEIGFGNSIEDLVETAESMGGRILRLNVTVCFLQPNSVEGFEAETIEELTAKINEAANGREYVARGWGICTTEDLKTSQENC
jgi:hypothetical protein